MLNDAIAGGGEQTFTVQIFRIREHLRDASVMHDDGGASARGVTLLWRAGASSRRAVEADRANRELCAA